MALTESTMMALGTKAPSFALPDTISDRIISFDEYKDHVAYVIMFICNHCPYVIHVNPEIVRLSDEYAKKNVAFIAISSNDVKNYPDDHPTLMKEQAKKLKYNFPYLYDESQEVAKAYDAACTPDFFVFDKNKKLVYRGRLDDSKPNSGIQLTGKDLRQALDANLSGTEINPLQYPSMGCNIKWRKS